MITCVVAKEKTQTDPVGLSVAIAVLAIGLPSLVVEVGCVGKCPAGKDGEVPVRLWFRRRHRQRRRHVLRG